MVLFLIFLGVCFLIVGIRMIYADDKFWWWSKSSPTVPTSVVFTAFPTALLFFLLAYIVYFQEVLPTEVKDRLAFFIGLPLFVSAVILSIWQPRWLKPKWLRWLETNHGSIILLLQEEARKEEWSDWERKVKTQEGLEKWVAEVLEKNNL